MNTKTIIKISVFIALPVIFLTGCMSFNPKSMRTMEEALLESNPDLSIESSMKFGVGALTMDFVDLAFVHDDSIDVSKISRADIGIYELSGEADFSTFEPPMQAYGYSRCPEWNVIVRVREENEHVLVVACVKEEKVTAVSVFVLEPREVVVVNARGNFNSMMSSLVKATTRRERQTQDTAAI